MKKVITNIAVVLGAILCMVGFLFIALQERRMYGCITSYNLMAKFHYNAFSPEMIDLSAFVDIPEKGSFYIVGECKDNVSYTAYAGDLFTQDTRLFGKESVPNSYWGVRIVDGIIMETWASNYPFKTEQLHPYTVEQQKKLVHLFEASERSKIIGYYAPKDTQS